MIFYGCTDDNGTDIDFFAENEEISSDSAITADSDSSEGSNNPSQLGSQSSNSKSSTSRKKSSSSSVSSSADTTSEKVLSSSSKVAPKDSTNVEANSSSAISTASSSAVAGSSAALPLSSSTIPASSSAKAPSSSATVLSSSAKVNSSAATPASSATTPVSSATVLPSSNASAPSSSSLQESSSSGLKEYNDNHKPKASTLPAAGFYSSLTIEPLAPQKGGEIRCTFDGSFPTVKSEQIADDLHITENTVVRCSEFVNGEAMDTTTQTYFINESVSMPVVAITVNHHDMFDSTDGLYATGNISKAGGGFGGGFGGGMWGGMGGGNNVTDDNNPKCTEPCKEANFWSDKELPAHVEFFENGSSSKTKNWEIDAGISIVGNWSRYKPKKSVAIKMDNDIYGDKILKYSLFKTRPEAKKIKAFNLRNNGNRFWTDYIGDAMMTALLEGTDVDYQRSRQVVVFYNGEYFGIHDMRERLNRHFVETNYGIDAKSINMINIKGSELEASGTNGSSVTEYQQLVSEIGSTKYAGENNEKYEKLKSKLNVNSFAQYMFAEMYFHNGDWPTNNVRAWGGNGHPFKFVAFDTDHGFGFTPGISGFDVENQNMFTWVLGNNNSGGMWGGMGGGATAGPGTMLKKLLENPDFKRMFINNACILLNSYLTYEKVQKTVQSMMATIPSSEQSRDEQRWPRTQTNFRWTPSGNDLIAYAKGRSETIKKEMADYFDLEDEVSVTIAASGSGSVQVDGMKLPSKNYQCKFFSNNEILLTAIAESGAVFTGWSDGSIENPHKVLPSEGLTIKAIFK